MIADMPQDTSPSALYADFADLAGRREALRELEDVRAGYAIGVAGDEIRHGLEAA